MNIDPKSETQKPDPRVFLLNKGLGDLVLNPHKPHNEWVYASDAIAEYVQFENQLLRSALAKTRELIYFKDAEIVGGWLVKPDQIDFGTVLTTIDRAIQTPEP